ncbi:MAG TPA: nickel pincer cofactor biosynthesis protein LarB [Firmicutes bacterium]|nr:nickel pincer cofactor biosynthesis protein LarB [Bacillota bacterium]HBK67286.1 nickel pincer cofactor biosynthesis protein LarB [Bacillota bacterium]HBT15493.1 nickel pincer cofactor biosynthesis protein LarB [Bacillota bacterium]
MNNLWLSLLYEVKEGKVSPEKALESLADLPYEDLGFAKIDHHRQLRQGATEVIYCPGKTDEQVIEIFKRLAPKGGNILATRAAEGTYQKVKQVFPEACYYQLPRLIVLSQDKKDPVGLVTVLTAGTADQAVAEEAALTLEVMGSRVERYYDVGVAGIHRLLKHRKKMEEANVILVVAGMEGALASVVGGLVRKPIIAVPTSVGYGANFQGLAPLLTMLNSCAAGIGVVNIDNGFGAGVLAHRINTGVNKE